MLRNENITETGLPSWLDAVKRDAKLAARMVAKSPLFATMAVLSLALGIGANTMVFTLMEHVVLDSLPVPHAEQLVILHDIGRHNGHTYNDGMNSSFSYPMYRDLNAEAGSIFTG